MFVELGSFDFFIRDVVLARRVITLQSLAGFGNSVRAAPIKAALSRRRTPI